MRRRIRILALVTALVLLMISLAVPAMAEMGKMDCDACGATGVCAACAGTGKAAEAACADCGGTGVCAACGGAKTVAAATPLYNSVFALVPPVIAIALALITKEVYSSLAIGVVSGAVLYSCTNVEGIFKQVFDNGIIGVLSDSYNVGILLFLVILGIIVCMMNRAGGSEAFGRWASKHIHTRVGAQLATIALGCLIFIDDYFNCLTVGSVMRPVTDKHQVSRAKLAYLIDATAAPVCIIAPVSSWAAAVAGFAEDGQGLNLFIRAIPYNFYAILTIVTMVSLVLLKMDFGSMKAHEVNAAKGDLFSGKNPYTTVETKPAKPGATMADLVLPVVMLIVCCVIGMIYSGGFFAGASFIDAFSNSDASIGLAYGSSIGMLLTILFYGIRGRLKLSEMMECVPEGFKAMVPAILILTLAWSLKAQTDALGAKYFVRDLVANGAAGLQMFLPAIVFIIGALLAFATGTSWGTFGILIPIVQSVFSMDNPLAIVCISACMAGAVCGDHCSPISDTTIMASAGAQCEHVNHVSTQLPYAVLVAAVSFVSYILAGFIPNAVVVLPIAIILMLLTLIVMKNRQAD